MKSGGTTSCDTQDRASVRFSQLSEARQLLIRLCQRINFGELRDIQVLDREPVFEASQVLVDRRLDGDETARVEAQIPDFELCDEFRRLLDQLDVIDQGRISRIEIRAGLPRRLLFESPFSRLVP